jgi:hypothetical protein
LKKKDNKLPGVSGTLYLFPALAETTPYDYSGINSVITTQIDE